MAVCIKKGHQVDRVSKGEAKRLTANEGWYYITKTEYQRELQRQETNNARKN